MSQATRSAVAIRHRPALVTLTYVVLIALTQTGSILREVIDWDESTFILMSQSLLNGHLPYTQMFDNKPPVLFFLLAGAMALFGESLWTVRLLGDLCLLISALAVFGTVLRLGGSAVGAGWAGAICIASHALPVGQYTSSEIPATAMLMSALWVMVSLGDTRRGAVLSGLAISIAVLLRTNLATVAIAVAVYVLVRDLQRLGPRRLLGGNFLPFAIAGLAPLGLLVAVYAASENLANLRLGLIDVPLRYATQQADMFLSFKHHAAGWLGAVRREPAVWGSLTVLALLGIWRSIVLLIGPGSRSAIALLWVMTLSITVGMLQSGASYPHYWLQLFPFLAVFAGLVLTADLSLLRFGAQGIALISVVASLLMTAPQTFALMQDPGKIERSHRLRAAADYIASKRTEPDVVWAPVNHLVLWYLDMPPVSGAITHPSNLTRGPIIDTLVEAGYAPPDLLEEIYRAEPTFVVTDEKGSPPWYLPDKDQFTTFLMQNYRIGYRAKGVTVFERLEISDND